MSFIMNQMNFILRTVFFMQAMICIALSIAGILWEHKNLALHSYLGSVRLSLSVGLANAITTLYRAPLKFTQAHFSSDY
mgnify:FL=1